MTVLPLRLVRGASSTAPAESFEEFFRSQYPGIVRAVAVVADDIAVAEDLVQEAMVRTYLRWGRVGGFASPSGYVYRTAVNLHRSHLRRSRILRRRVLPDTAVGYESTDQTVVWTDLINAIKRLPAGQRDALLLVEWFGLTSDAAAPLLGVAPGSVRSRVARARASLASAEGAELIGGEDD